MANIFDDRDSEITNGFFYYLIWTLSILMTFGVLISVIIADRYYILTPVMEQLAGINMGAGFTIIIVNLYHIAKKQTEVKQKWV